MKIAQFLYTKNKGWQGEFPDEPMSPNLVLVFGNQTRCNTDVIAQWLQENYPNVPVMGCSTAGEIFNTEVYDDSFSITAIEFEHAQTQLEQVDFKSTSDSKEVGVSLAKKFKQKDLRWLFVLSDGLNINGTQLVAGINSVLPKEVIVTGGLAGDGTHFEQTTLCLNQHCGDHRVIALGVYGEHLQVGYGSLGGWDPFGPDRKITKSNANVLYELDGQSALELYKTYLGEYAKDLPASGLLFPLKVTNSAGLSVVRTLLSIDESDGGMHFAGDVPEGDFARLMKANFDRLVDGASGAAEQTQKTSCTSNTELAILISCVGRKMVLEQRIEEEVESVREVLGNEPILTGFYSYGEICPILDSVGCNLHNQTMTITTLSEILPDQPIKKGEL